MNGLNCLKLCISFSSRMSKKSQYKSPRDGDQGLDPVHPATTASFLSLITFSWINDVLKTGSKLPLGKNDFLPLHEEDRTRQLTEHLQNLWNNDVTESSKQNRKPKLWKSVLKFIPLKDVCISWLTILTFSTCIILQPLLLWGLLGVLRSADEKRNIAYVYAALMGLTLLSSVAAQFACYKCDVLGMRLSSAIKGVIYLKVRGSSNGAPERRFGSLGGACRESAVLVLRENRKYSYTNL